MWGMTLEDGIRNKLGTERLKQIVVDMNPINVILDRQLNESFDARSYWNGQIHPIKNQGICASSWAFSTTGLHLL